MAGHAMGDRVGRYRMKERRGGAGDIAVKHDGNSVEPRGRDGAHHRRDFTPAAAEEAARDEVAVF